MLHATCVGSINLRLVRLHHIDPTDPRNKIFTFLSLASDRADLGGRDIFPAYIKSCVEAYISAMTALLSNLRSPNDLMLMPPDKIYHGRLC